MPILHTIHRRYEPPGEGDPYRLLPFEVPAGASQLTVRYRYAPLSDREASDEEGRAPGCVVDLGLFDPRGHAFLDAPGFRGWSGGARSEATIGAATATPGYLPGALQAGTWHVLLGLYRVPPGGCEVWVEVEVAPGAPGGAAPRYRPPGVLREGTRWYRGDLHCHSHHSDATGGVPDLVAAARAQGLDYLAVTDHNTPSHLPDLAAHAPPDLLLIPGIEITTYRGHANVWGVRGWHEFRTVCDAGMAQIRERVRAQGLLFSINHPKLGGPPWQYGSAFAPDAVEVWQTPWFLLHNHQSLAFWEGLLREGARPTLVGGSDKHQKPYDGAPSGYEVGMPTTWVYAHALSEEAILDGVRRGHVYVSQNAEGPRLSFEAQAGGEVAMMGDPIHVEQGERIVYRCRVQGAPQGALLRAVGRDGEVWRGTIAGEDWTATWTGHAAGQADYCRVEVIEPPAAPPEQRPEEVNAYVLSNPIYLSVEG
ncbi:MAG: PHP domain-containing protein [Anaerolineae bacterium]|nr:PHP domain-containing protein [Anaerolineae bacterium]